MQQHNVKFLNPPEPDPMARFVEKAARAITLARSWANETRAVGLPDLLPLAASSDLRALLTAIDARQVLEPSAAALMASVIDACGASLAAAPAGSNARDCRLASVLAQRDALLPVVAAIDEALDLAAALRMGRDLARR